ncbi:M23 family metallopeptidase [Alicyclobacillus sp. ALC3]|uniref:M23 family metallopeptidase n=1 Tax=Alicyclobacillus sp. ALC3 TaxID=2796143 RepID=UPI002377D4D9|nr:M23 family metallopeptidase [Alicyclobacillus sp. ALC3]WDL96996.1 M23 family metallopeptidase [Alicyclobacillus sp. ALC3]
MATEHKDGKWTLRRSWPMRRMAERASAEVQQLPNQIQNPLTDEPDNPWLLLHDTSANPPMPPIESARRHLAEPSVYRTDVPTPTFDQSSQRVRWLSEASSPYGFSDEDGSLKQGDADTWRKAFSGSSQQPSEAVRAAGGRKPPTSAGPSTWWYQLVAAAVLVAGGVYSVHAHTAVAADVRGVYQSAFAQDQGTALWTRVNRFMVNHHIAIPGLSTNFGAIKMHVPLQGSIVRNYSVGQPEMLIQGTAGEHVLAAGSGTVTKVAQLSGGDLIEINHGSIGTTWYTGVVKPTVRVNEYVTAGEIIGQLPATPAHPTLQFALEKNNRFENPHDYIVFPGSLTAP